MYVGLSTRDNSVDFGVSTSRSFLSSSLSCTHKHTPVHARTNIQGEALVDSYGARGHSRKLSNGGRVSTSGILSSLKSLLWTDPEEKGRGSEDDRGRGSVEEERGRERAPERGSGFGGHDNSSDDDDSGVHSR